MQTSVDEVIPLVESSDTLEVVLKYLYPERRSKLADGMEFKLLDSVAEAAEKYQVWAAMDVCLDRMKNTLPQHADSILVYAKKHGYTELMDLAAIPLLDQNCEQVLRFLPDDLKVSWAIYYYKWSVVQLQACTAHNKWYGECTKQECRDILSRMAEAPKAGNIQQGCGLIPPSPSPSPSSSLFPPPPSKPQPGSLLSTATATAMSTAGLSRRRAPAASTHDPDDDVPAPSRTNSTSGSISNGSAGGGTVQHAGSAFAGGSKIAYDPRDLDQDAGEEARIGGKMPRLTIMEEVLLLGIKDKQGYLSFWNDNISYALRGCILIELALRRRIALVKDPNRRRAAIADRLVEVIDDRQTGETILDEALRMMKGQEHDKMGINSWIDLLSGETWNVMKIGFQLKQVRERLAKGLVDKGVLRTEKRNFLLFDMATHPVADVRTKESIISRAVALLTSTTASIPPAALDREGTQCRVLRAVCLVCAAHTASVLDNAFGRLGYEEREAAFGRCDEILAEFSCWPFGSADGYGSSGGTAAAKRRLAARIGSGSGSGEVSGREAVMGLVTEVRKEALGEEDLGFELVAGVLEVLSKLDSLL
ncbi:putative golgi phosphoprotein 3 (GPP34) [Lyophyllum shimeji]|uniref:Golgi phosphoprotein 3 (GPP34) n=1 Tax=Lyophyllum shimeji TaxID=47721 RepID=A0A9P3PQ05_LYOSH|nr:putative golgi phosphoprotein 3 (GPP34) [Lyophyllum shimeji]